MPDRLVPLVVLIRESDLETLQPLVDQATHITATERQRLLNGWDDDKLRWAALLTGIARLFRDGSLSVDPEDMP